jgi:hypothetical protein
MKRFVKYYLILVNSFVLMFSFSVIVFAQNTGDKQNEEQYKLRQFEEIKKTKDKEFKKGAYNDEKKDVVNNWIGEDINYQKRVIKLKSDYRAWAEKKVSAKEEVIFTDYEPLKNLTRVEKQVLQEYHNKLFGKDSKNIRAGVRNIEKRIIKKASVKRPVNELPDLLKQAIAFQPDNILNTGRAANSFLVYLLPASAGLIIIAGIFILVLKKPHKKSRSNSKKRISLPRKKTQGR